MMIADIKTSMPTLFIPHGGGPCFFMKENFGPPGTWDRMEAHLRGLSDHIPQKPKAILVISAHWEEERPTVMTAAQPPLLYDYYGFPDYTYDLQYPAPGCPGLAARTQDLLHQHGFQTGQNDQRGFDHGTFIPFMLIYPAADIPITQLSLQQDLDPALHIRMGQALAALRDEGVLIVGSGLSYHNLGGFFRPSRQADQDAANFDDWLSQTATQSDADLRNSQLTRWDQAPGAKSCHPRSEHLIPLMVIAGAAGQDQGHRIYADVVMGKANSSFLFK